MLTSREEQEERRRVALQDADLRRQQQREQAGTFFSHAQSAANDTAGGRFGAIGHAQVVGAGPVAKYPAASTPFQSDPVGTEPPLGFSVEDMPDPTGVPAVTAPVEPGAPAADDAPPSALVPPLADDVEPGTGARPFSKGQPND